MQYKKIKILGKGAYGKVYLVEKQCEKKDINRCENEGGTTELYALKSLEKNKDCIVSFNTEIKLFSKEQSRPLFVLPFWGRVHSRVAAG